jgi:hypothetical protein
VLAPDLLGWYRPRNVRAAFLVDRERVVRYARVEPDLLDLVHPDELLAAIGTLSPSADV